MATFILTTGLDDFQGTAEADFFRGFNNTLNAGDRVDGSAGVDTVTLATDASLGSPTFSGFTFNDVEIFDVTNGSTVANTFNLSGATGLTTLRSSNSAQGVQFNAVNSTLGLQAGQGVVIANQNNTAFTYVAFTDAALAGTNDTVRVTLQNAQSGEVRLGTATNATAGVENVTLASGTGASSITRLNTDLTILTIASSGSLVIGANSAAAVTAPSGLTALNGTVRLVSVTADSGNVAVNLSAATAGVGYIRDAASAGRDVVQGSTFADFIQTGAGDDRLFGGGGADTIRAGAGNNYVVTQSLAGGSASVTTLGGNDRVVGGAGTDVIDTGAGADIVDLRGGGRDAVATGAGDDLIIATDGFDASTTATVVQDFVDGGAGRDELRVSAGLTDGALQNVSNVEVLTITSAGTTVLSGSTTGGTTAFAQAAGIDQVNLDVSATFNADTARAGGTPTFENHDDVLDASTFSRGLTVTARGGTDSITTGSGNDRVVMTGDNSLTDADVLVAGAGSDTLELNGDTTVEVAQFSGFETIVLGSGRGATLADDVTNGNVYDLTLTNANAPTATTGTPATPATLVINASALSGTAVTGQVAETLIVDATAVTAYNLDITGGSGRDTIVSGMGNDRINGGAGNDLLTLLGGNNTLDAGADDDVVDVVAGNNTVSLGTGNDIVFLGTGFDTVTGGEGNDLFIARDNLDTNDSVNGGAGIDTLRINTTTADSAFTNVTNVEVLDIAANMDVTLGARASAAGFTTIVASGTGANSINATGFTASGLTFDLKAGGDDNVFGTSQNDLVALGTGNNGLFLGAGNDTVVVSGSNLNFSDTIDGGAGTDTVLFDNANGDIAATVNLDIVRNVEAFTFASNGLNTPAVANNNVIAFTGGAAATTAPLQVNLSNLSDPRDVTTVVLNGVTSSSPINITGAVAGISRVIKIDDGTVDTINFTGGASTDQLVISGRDLTSAVSFNGGAGADALVQIGSASAITDAGFTNITNVEVLSSGGGVGNNAVNATLGANAARSGINTVVGGSGNDIVTLASGYNAANLTIDLRTTSGGDDTINGSASAAALTVLALGSDVTAADVLVGGNTAGDVLTLRSNGTASNITGVAGFETINFGFAAGTVAAGNNGITLTADTQAGEVAGGSLTINASNFDADDVLTLNFTSGALDANVRVTGGAANDVINTGNGDDTIRGGLGNDTINAGNGTNFVFGEGGNDTITGGSGIDILDGGIGDDRLFGGAGNDTMAGGIGTDVLFGQGGTDLLFGDAGFDFVYGGAGADTLAGGAGADTFYYKNGTDSAAGVRDTISDFQSGVDRIDIRNIATTGNGTSAVVGATIAFAGNVADFGSAQGAIVAGDGIIQSVFQQDQNLLWFDLDDNGILNGNDLQIVLQGVSTITGADVYAGATINSATTAEAAADAFVAMNSTAMMGAVPAM